MEWRRFDEIDRPAPARILVKDGKVLDPAYKPMAPPPKEYAPHAYSMKRVDSIGHIDHRPKKEKRK